MTDKDKPTQLDMFSDGDMNVEWSDQVKEAAANDETLAEVLRNFGAAIRQAHAGVQSGQYKDIHEGITKITGGTVTPYNPDEVEDEECG